MMISNIFQIKKPNEETDGFSLKNNLTKNQKV